MLLGFAAFTFGLVAAVASEVPSLDPARQQARELNGYVYANDGKTILAVLRGDENRVLVDSDDIAPMMKHAIVAIEDRRFYDHRGVDLRGIVRAAWEDVRNKDAVQGGSTITQQYVKNAYAGNERTIARKVREAALAWQLENQWRDKDRILTAYLNTIYFGNGAYGIQQAARIYFGHGAKRLSVAESALLAGIPQDPSHYDPVANPDDALARRNLVLRAMHDQGYITAADLAAALKVPLPKPEDVRQPGTQSPHAPYFTNYVTDQLVDRFGAPKVYGGGLRVTTTIDLGLQELARKAIAEHLDDPEGPEAALVALDPKTGNVLAMVGGRNYRESQFNLAVQGQRQPGSAFKPFVLATALEKGISPGTTMTSSERSISLGDKLWTPHNYEDSYLGPITLETATVHSDNAVYAQLAALVGLDDVIRVARRDGRDEPDEAVLLARPRDAGGEPARARAVLRGLRERGLPARHPRPQARDDLEPAARRGRGRGRRGQRRRRLPAAAAARALGADGVDREPAAAGRRPGGHGDAGGDPRLERRGQDRHHRELRRRVVRRVHARARGRRLGRLPEGAAADADGVRRRVGHRRLVPGGDLQDVRRAGAALPRQAAGRLRPAAVGLGRAARGRPARRPPPARQRQLPQRVHRPLLRRRRAEADGELQAERGRGPEPRRPEARRPRSSASRSSRSGRSCSTAPPSPASRSGVVVEQIPRKGRASAYDEIQLWLAKPMHGVIPRVQGLTLGTARQKLGRLKLDVRVASWTDGPPFRVISQVPQSGRRGGARDARQARRRARIEAELVALSH